MNDGLAAFAAFVRADILPDDPQGFVRDSAWSMTFLALGVAVGSHLTAEALLGQLCATAMPMVGTPCVDAYATANQVTVGAAVAAAAMVVVAMWLTFRGDE